MELVKIKSAFFDKFTEEEFLQFCNEQRHTLKIERNSKGEIIIMSPSFPETSRMITQILFQIVLWNNIKNQGIVFESSAGFTLPNGAMRAPDLSWVSKSKWEEVMRDEANKNRFPHVVPDFLIEVRSAKDSLAQQKEKLEEWIENGVKLGWLIDPKKERTHVYDARGLRVVKGFDETLTGQEILNGFEIKMRDVLKYL